MDAIRAFIAIELPLEVRQRLDEISQTLQTRCFEMGGKSTRRAVRWVPAENIHLTLKFLGEVSSGSVQELARMLRVEAVRHPSFQISVNGIGTFPNIRRPRVIWAGSEVPPELTTLQEAIETGTRALGYPSEERPFSPHLTLGRVSQNASSREVGLISQALSELNVGSLGEMVVRDFHLFQSDLRPSGAVYTSLHTFPLAVSNPAL